jgi:D-alanine-D-alanine ligase
LRWRRGKVKNETITSEEWHAADRSRMFMDIINTIGFPFVVKSPHRSSSIGLHLRKRSLDGSPFDE